MKALMLTVHPDLPSSRFRAYQYVRHIRQAGIHVDVRPVMPARLYGRLYGSRWLMGRALFHACELGCRAKHLLSARRYDVVFVQKYLSSLNLRVLGSLLTRLRLRMVYDLDDAVYLGQGPRPPRALNVLCDARQADLLIRCSRVVLAGNATLRDHAGSLGSEVRVVPTGVDTDEFAMRPAADPGGPVVLLWTGSYGSNRYLGQLSPVLAALARERRVDVLAVSNHERHLDAAAFAPARFRFRRWRRETELGDLHEGGIGLFPLPDTAFARGKCAFKALQYMACGIPVVASDVGVNREVVQDGVTGFLVRTDADWHGRLRRLLDDADLRNRMGRAGRERAVSHYSAETVAPMIVQALRDAAAG